MLGKHLLFFELVLNDFIFIRLLNRLMIMKLPFFIVLFAFSNSNLRFVDAKFVAFVVELKDTKSNATL